MTMKAPWHHPQRPATWQRAGVYGLGLSGRAAATFLRRQGVEVMAFDRRSIAEIGPDLGALANDPGVELRLGREPDPAEVDLSRLDGVVTSPGVALDQPLLQKARAADLPVIAEVELAAPFLEGPLVGITGSNGKSTTTAMTGAILRAAGFDARVCGNIGSPLVGEIPEASSAAPVYVVELSSFQLETIVTLRPKAGVLLNLSADHLDRHNDMAGYLAAKRRLFMNMNAGDVAIWNADDPNLEGLSANPRTRVRLFSRRSPVIDGCFLENDRIYEAWPSQANQPLFAVDDVAVPGAHNLENAMAAALLARALDVAPAAIVSGLRSFQALPHRIEKVRELDGVTFYDDSKGTNPASTEGAILGFAPERLLIILGGRHKGGDLGPLAQAVKARARRAFLIGEAAPIFAAALGGVSAAFELCGTLDRALARACAEARPGDAILLSPACASFDQFRNYVDRGLTFQRLVRALAPAAVAAGGEHGS